MMKRLLTVASIILLAHNSSAEKRTISCKTPTIAASCFMLHGRLQFGNGTPALRLWQIGTRHEFGIFSGLQGLNCDRDGKCLAGQNPEDNENPQLPMNIEAIFTTQGPFGPEIFADYEVCPLEPHIEGHMQAACIESAKHIVVQK